MRSKILPLLVLLSVLTLGVVAARMFFPDPENYSPVGDPSPASDGETKDDLPTATEVNPTARDGETEYEEPLPAPKKEMSKVSKSLKPDTLAGEAAQAKTASPGYKTQAVESGSVSWPPARLSSPKAVGTKSRDRGGEESLQSRSIISPEQHRELMRLYIEALTHLRD